MMKRTLLFFTALLYLLSIYAISPHYPEDDEELVFTVEYVGQSTNNHPKMPPQYPEIPVVRKSGYMLLLDNGCDYSLVQILTFDGDGFYEFPIGCNIGYIILPSNLHGSIEVKIIKGNFIFKSSTVLTCH